jgi:N-dimethylarginine dimethylaminohydrolase
MLIDWLISKLRGKNSGIPYQVNTYSGRVEVNPEDIMKSDSFKSSMSDVKKLRELVENRCDTLDLAELANEFLHLKRCKSCTRLTLDEYICYWCKHDES